MAKETDVSVRFSGDIEKVKFPSAGDVEFTCSPSEQLNIYFDGPHGTLTLNIPVADAQPVVDAFNSERTRKKRQNFIKALQKGALVVLVTDEMDKEIFKTSDPNVIDVLAEALTAAVTQRDTQDEEE